MQNRYSLHETRGLRRRVALIVAVIVAVLQGLYYAAGLTSGPKAVVEWAAGVLVALIVIIYAFRIIDRIYGEMQTQQQQLETTLEHLAQSEGRYRRSEEEIRQQRDRLEAILESTNEAILMLDTEGRCVVANQRVTDFFGLARGQMYGMAGDELFSQLGQALADKAGFEQITEGLLSDPEVIQTREFDVVQPNPRTLMWYSVPVRNDQDITFGRISIFRDVTAERQADKMKSEFVSMVSHELRTPLTSIKGFTDLMLAGDAGPLSNDQDEFLKIVQSNVNRLVALIEDLLDVSRIEAGQITLQPTSVNVGQVIREVAHSIRPQLSRKDQSLVVEVPKALPAAWGDRDRTTQILVNLVANAHKYSPDSSSITITARASDELHVSVSDTGQGIAPADQAHLFDRFYRAGRSTSYRSGGTGLGLSIARSLVEAQGGRIWVDSVLGEGSTFSFTLPLAPEVALIPTQVTGFAEAACPGKHILVVEDEPAIADLLRYQLEKAGYSVTSARNGQEGLRAARELLPDLITLDILLPDIDGFETIRRLQADKSTRDIPVVIVSIVRDDAQALQLGVDAYLTKPIDERRLLDTVAGLLSDHEKILIVDDDSDILNLLRNTLRRHRFPTTTARGGSEALARIAAERPALVLLDLKMPGVDGYQVLRTLKSRSSTRNIPVIIMTGIDAYKSNIGQVMAIGATDFLTKPFDLNELVAEIRKILGTTPVPLAGDGAPQLAP
ncbi:MAG: response regulator [Anaerolineae bacterium]